MQKEELRNSTITLVLGILSIVTCFCYGIIGLVLGIVALVISNEDVRRYKADPDRYLGYGNLNAGRICAIIGICLSAIYLLIILFYLIILGTSIPFQELMNK